MKDVAKGWKARGHQVAAGLALLAFGAAEARAIEHRFLRLPNGNLLAAAGYGHYLAEIDAASKIVKRIDGSSQPPKTYPNFWCGYQVLKK